MAQQSSKDGDRKGPISLVLPQTGKTRAGRIPLDYYKKRTDLSVKKLLLSGILIVAGLGYVFSGEFFNEGGTARLGPIELSRDARINHGPLHLKHAGFEKQCNLCHEPFAAIGSGRAMPSVGPYAINSWQVSDKKCQACHAGPEHHPMKEGGAVLACADCHRDHLGRNVELARQSDHACIDCHKDLDVAGRDPKPSGSEEPIAKSVSHFEFHADGKASAHPNFRSLLSKSGHPSQLKFNHDRHTTPGMGINATLARVSEGYRGLYRTEGQTDQSLIRALECADCHQLDNLDLKRSLTKLDPSVKLDAPLNPSPDSGSYFPPPRFDIHCAGCHSLAVDFRPGASASGDMGKLLSIPHHQQPDAVVSYVRNAFALSSLTESGQGKSDEGGKGGRMIGRPPSESADPLTKHQEEIDKTWRMLFEATKPAPDSKDANGQTCMECHRFAKRGADGSLQPMDDADVLNAIREMAKLQAEGKPSDQVRVRSPEIPVQWLKHGRFNHVSHRAFKCDECHQVDRDPAKRAGKADDPESMIPDILNCVKCHKDEPASGGWLGVSLGSSETPVSVRNNCLECHRYHHGEGDGPAQGLGAKARDARETLTIEDFTRGRMTTAPSASPSSAPAAANSAATKEEAVKSGAAR